MTKKPRNRGEPRFAALSPINADNSPQGDRSLPRPRQRSSRRIRCRSNSQRVARASDSATIAPVVVALRHPTDPVAAPHRKGAEPFGPRHMPAASPNGSMVSSREPFRRHQSLPGTPTLTQPHQFPRRPKVVRAEHSRRTIANRIVRALFGPRRRPKRGPNLRHKTQTYNGFCALCLGCSGPNSFSLPVAFAF